VADESPPLSTTFAAYVRDIAREVFLELRAEESGHSVEHCVDDKIIAELERKWTRLDPPNSFGLLETLKRDDPRHWVSPEVSLRMLASLEFLARNAYAEGTRAL
jgi:hypothetical protein